MDSLSIDGDFRLALSQNECAHKLRALKEVRGWDKPGSSWRG
jgi:hypothetical protein